MKIVLFNGPPRAGKDTGAEIAKKILKKYGQCRQYRMAHPLKEAVHALFGFKCGVEYFDSTKGVPNAQMFDMTPREAYIWLSEECVKPKFGSDAFAKIAARNMSNWAAGGMVSTVISDCGFIDELKVLMDEFGPENVCLIRMHREGCDFKSDSRGYVNHDMLCSYDVINNSTKEDLEEVLYHLIERFMS